MNDIILSVQNGEPVVSSRQIAENFEKRHDHVMRDIEDIMKGLPKNGDTHMFFKTEYTHEQNGQTYSMYLMNRDGFTLLAMGFTGKAALEWKLKYIAAFNEMEKKLTEQPQLTRSQLLATALIAAHEELEEKDVRLYGVDGVLDRRSANHILRMAAELDNVFFAAAAGKATVLNLSAYKAISDELEAIIQECETTQNDFVDGVPRSMMHLVLSPKYYGMIRNDLDKQTNNANVNTAAEEFLVWHGVRAYSCVHLPAGCNYLLLVDGAVAQPVMADQYVAEKIPLSNAYGVELFYHYGTTVVMPDLIFKPGVFTKASAYAAGTQYYTEANGVYTAVSITEFASGTTYYTMA